MRQVFVIRMNEEPDPCYLESGSCSYGSQGGIARVWTKEMVRAMTFESEREAESYVREEFGDTRRYYDLSIVKNLRPK